MVASGDTVLAGGGNFLSYRYANGEWQKLRAPQDDVSSRSYSHCALSDDTAVLVKGDQLCFTVREDEQWSESQVIEVGSAITGTPAVFGEWFLVPLDAGITAFRRTGSTWSEQQVLVGSDGPGSLAGPLALSENTAVILGGGAAYVFTLEDESFSEVQKLVASDGHDFTDLRLSGDTVLLASASGLHLFARSAGTWSFQAVLAIDSPYFDLLGDLVLAGTLVYRRAGDTWSFWHDFTANGPLATYTMGRSPFPVQSVDDSEPISARLWQGGALFATVREPYLYDGLKFEGYSELHSFELVTEPDSCSTDDDCASQHCADGVCCRTACEGPSHSCRAADNGDTFDGECKAVSTSTPSASSLTASGGGGCGFAAPRSAATSPALLTLALAWLRARRRKPNARPRRRRHGQAPEPRLALSWARRHSHSARKARGAK